MQFNGLVPNISPVKDNILGCQSVQVIQHDKPYTTKFHK